MTPLQEDLFDAVHVIATGSTALDPRVPTQLLPWYRPAEGGGFRGGAREVADWRRFVEDRRDAEAEHPAIQACLEAIDGALHPDWQRGSFGGDRPWAIRQVLEGFCERVFDGLHPSDLRDSEVLAERVDDAHPELLRFLVAETHSVGYTCPLAGLRLPHGPVSIDAHTRLEPFSELEREGLWHRVGIKPGTYAPFQFPNMADLDAAFSQIVISVDLPSGQAMPMDVLQHPMWDVVDAVRLGVDGRPYPLAAYETFPRFDVYLSRFYSLGLLRPARTARGAPSVVDAPQDLPLERIWQNLRRCPEHLSDQESAALNLAMQRLKFAYDRGGDEDRLIDCWIAFEALFLPDTNQELSYRASMRIARFVADEPDERPHLFMALKRLYGARSVVAHGGRQSERKKYEPMEQRADEALRILRRAVVRWIEPSAARSPEALDLALLS